MKREWEASRGFGEMCNLEMVFWCFDGILLMKISCRYGKVELNGDWMVVIVMRRRNL